MLRAVRRPFDRIDPARWDALAGANPWATPFSSWAFARAWWDGYGANAHEETLVFVPAGAPDDAEPVAIAPLMHRHEVEPDDVELGTSIRHADGPPLTPVSPDAKAVFFGASYHADYATLLGDPADLPAAADALAAYCSAVGDPDHPLPWDAVDLRRLRAGDPAAEALAQAFGAREIANGWTLNVEREDVCPVAVLPVGATPDEFFATLGKKERHEIRRKVRRAEAAGEVRLDDSADPLADLPAFIDLHQKRWGADGLFPETPGGEQSRVFFHRLFELFPAGGPLSLAFLTVGGRRIAAGRHLPDRRLAALLQRRRGPRGARAVARRADGGALPAARAGARPDPAGLPARRRTLQVRVGCGGRTHPTPAGQTNDAAMTPPHPDDPCVRPMVHLPVPGSRARARRPGHGHRYQRRRPGACVQPGLEAGPRVL